MAFDNGMNIDYNTPCCASAGAGIGDRHGYGHVRKVEFKSSPAPMTENSQ
jgi:hypothetical protein